MQIRTVLGTEDVEDGKYLSVIRYEGLTDHVSRDHQMLQYLERTHQRKVTPRTQRVYMHTYSHYFNRVRGFDSVGKGSNFWRSHRKEKSPLTQGLNYCSACENKPCNFSCAHRQRTLGPQNSQTCDRQADRQTTHRESETDHGPRYGEMCIGIGGIACAARSDFA